MNNSDLFILFALGFWLGVVTMLMIGFFILEPDARNNVMREAYERGHAVECLGKTGYHWECE